MAHFFGRNAGRHAQLLKARLAMTHAVEADFFVLVACQMQHFHAQQFKRSQEFGATLEQKRRIGTGEFDQDLRPLPIAVVSNWWVDRDAVFQLEPGVLHYSAEKYIELVCRFDFVHKEASSDKQRVNEQPQVRKLTPHR